MSSVLSADHLGPPPWNSRKPQETVKIVQKLILKKPLNKRQNDLKMGTLQRKRGKF